MKLSKDLKQLDRIKDLIDEIKSENDKELIVRTTQQLSDQQIEYLRKTFKTSDIHIEILDKNKYVGGTEIIYGGNVYSNLISSEIAQIKNLLKKENSA